LQKINSYKPDIVISLGLASDRIYITPELRAQNLIDCKIPNNDGILIRNQKIDESANAHSYSDLPIEQMIQSCLKLNIQVESSNDAGTYVCNYLMYQTLFSSHKHYRAGFIHIPMPIDLDPHSKSNFTVQQISHAIVLMLETI